MTYEEWHASYANGDTKSGKSSSAPHTKQNEQEMGAEKSPSPYATETLKVVDKYFKKNSVENLAESSKIKSDLQFFAKKHKPKKVPDDDPLWDSLVKGDVEKQMEDGIFEWEHGGYDYLIEIKDRYTYDILSRKKKPNIHE